MALQSNVNRRTHRPYKTPNRNDLVRKMVWRPHHTGSSVVCTALSVARGLVIFICPISKPQLCHVGVLLIPMERALLPVGSSPCHSSERPVLPRLLHFPLCTSSISLLNSICRPCHHHLRRRVAQRPPLVPQPGQSSRYLSTSS
jgi:hypothetical protein